MMNNFHQRGGRGGFDWFGQRGRHFGWERSRRGGRRFINSFDFDCPPFPPTMRPNRNSFDPFVIPTWNAGPRRHIPDLGVLYFQADRPTTQKDQDSSDSGSTTDGEAYEILDEFSDRPKIIANELRRRRMKCSKKFGKNNARKMRKAIRRRMGPSKDFEVMLDVTGFRRENLKIKFDNNKLIIDGKHSEHPIEFVPMERQFTWKISLPEGIGKHDIKCRLLEGGVLHIVGTKPAPSTSNQTAGNGGGADDEFIQIDD